MVIYTIPASNCTPQTIVIGRRGTYDTMQIAFDLSFLIENYGSGTAVLAIKRSQDASAYPAVVTQEDATLLWTVNETDTAYVGSGECQLMWYVDGGLAKTIIYPMVVMRDILSTSEEPPDAYQTWVDDLIAKGEETLHNAQAAAQSATEAEQAKDDAVDAKEASEEAARKAAAASVHAPIIQNGFWYIWSDDQYVNTNVRAEGEKGDKGDTGEKGDTGNGIASITKTGTSGLVDTYTVTYTDGTSTTFTVTNGAKGDKGDTGATGNGIASIAKTGTSGNVDTYTITYTNGQTTTFTVTNGAVSSVAGKTGAVVLDSGDIEYDSTETYSSGTAGAKLNDLNRQLSDETTGLDTKAPVILETASGAIASFDDGADSMPIRKLVAQIEPVQDLHGYSNPWPGGGGVNKWDFLHPTSAQNATVTENSDGTFVAAGSTASAFLRYLVPVTANKRHVIFCSKSNATGNTGVLGLVNVFDGSDSSAAPLLTNALITDSAKAITPTGDYIFIVFTVTGGAGSGSATVSQPFIIAADEGIPVYSPYSNICPISGWTGAEIEQTGKNLLIKAETAYISPTDDYAVYLTGSGTSLFFNCVKGQTYTISGLSINRGNYAIFDHLPTASERTTAQGRPIPVNNVLTFTAQKSGVCIVYVNNGTVDASGAQIELGSTATAYEPYTGNQISVTFPDEAGDNGTVYGATMTLKPDRTGTLVVDRMADDLGDMYWDYSSAYGGFFATQSIKHIVSGQTWRCKCERYKNLKLNSDALLANDCMICINADNNAPFTGAQVFKALMVSDKKYNGDVDSFKSAVSGTKVVYELASPQTYQLTAEQVSGILSTLYGQNNVWADTGDIQSCEYPADTKLYIDNKITQAIANALNS